MTFPYIVEDGQEIRCLCKGCGDALTRQYLTRQGVRCHEIAAAYGDLYLALADSEGVVSEHSTPCCPSCAARVLGRQLTSELEEWWGADVFHWFVEERLQGQDPNTAYRIATKLQAGRHVVRALRYVPRT